MQVSFGSLQFVSQGRIRNLSIRQNINLHSLQSPCSLSFTQEGISKTSCTFFVWSVTRGKSLTAGNTVTGQMTCWHTDGFNLALTVQVAIEQVTWTQHFKFEPSKNTDPRYNLYGQRVLKMLKFTHVYVLSNRTLIFLSEVCKSGQKCSRNKSWTDDTTSIQCLGFPKT